MDTPPKMPSLRPYVALAGLLALAEGLHTWNEAHILGGSLLMAVWLLSGSRQPPEP